MYIMFSFTCYFDGYFPRFRSPATFFVSPWDPRTPSIIWVAAFKSRWSIALQVNKNLEFFAVNIYFLYTFGKTTHNWNQLITRSGTGFGATLGKFGEFGAPCQHPFLWMGGLKLRLEYLHMLFMGLGQRCIQCGKVRIETMNNCPKSNTRNSVKLLPNPVGK